MTVCYEDKEMTLLEEKTYVCQGFYGNAIQDLSFVKWQYVPAIAKTAENFFLSPEDACISHKSLKQDLKI